MNLTLTLVGIPFLNIFFSVLTIVFRNNTSCNGLCLYLPFNGHI